MNTDGIIENEAGKADLTFCLFCAFLNKHYLYPNTQNEHYLVILCVEMLQSSFCILGLQ